MALTRWAGPVKGTTIFWTAPLAGSLELESSMMAMAVALGPHHEPLQVNPQPKIPTPSGISVR